MQRPEPQREIIIKAVSEIHKLEDSGQLTFALAFKGKTLQWYRQKAGLVDTITTVTAYIQSICAAYKTEKTLSASEAVHIAKKIIIEHPTLKLAELPLFAKMAKQGQLSNHETGEGQVYGRIDEAVIFGMLKNFYSWQAEQIEILRAAEKISGGFNDWKPEAKSKLIGILKKIQAEQFQQKQNEKIQADEKLVGIRATLKLYWNLNKWFPKEIDALLIKINQRLQQTGKEPTIAVFLRWKPVKELISKYEEGMRRPNL